MKLDQYEQEILDSFEKGEWESVPDLEERKVELQKSARYTVENRNKKAISLRLPEGDLSAIKRRSSENGLPYQSMIQLLVHQFVTGKIEVRL